MTRSPDSNHWRYRDGNSDPRTLSERVLFGMWPALAVGVIIGFAMAWGFATLFRVLLDQQ